MSMSKQAVLALLGRNRGSYLSGEAMSKTLGVSRAAVWKAVDNLRREGYEISSAPNRGYRLESAPDKLSSGGIAGLLPPGLLLGREIAVLDTVDSTNSEVKRRSAAPEGLAVLAAEQTGGRGRRGRSFQSLAGKGLYLSLLLKPRLPLDQVTQLTAWTAVAVCDGVEEACGLRPGIKWTNDLILNGKKLCGILTELELEGETGELSCVIPGIGINVSQTEEDFGPELAEIATSLLRETGEAVPLDRLAASVLSALDRMYQAFPGEKERYLRRYRADCVTLGRPVRLIRPNGSEEAFALDIDDDFALRVRYPDGREGTVSSGEVSVRGLLGYTK